MKFSSFKFNLNQYLKLICLLLFPVLQYGQTFQTSIGLPLPAYEVGVSGVITLTGDYLILGSNSNHPAGLFNKNGDMHLCWINNNGNILNPGKIIGHDVYESAVWIEKAVDCSGNPGYIVAGNQAGSSGVNSILFTFLNLNGNPMWTRRITLLDAQSAQVKQDANGNYILVGTKTDMVTGVSTVIALKIDCSGQPIWEREYKIGLTAIASSVTAFAISSTSCNNLPDEYYITGRAIPPPAGNYTAFIVGVNANTGMASFGKYYDFGNGTDDIPACIQGRCSAITGPQLLISGHSVDPSDLNNPKKVMLFNTDLSGNLNWANTYDIQSSYREFSTNVQFDNNNQIILTGKAEETGVSDPPETGLCLLMHLNQNGAVVNWTRIFEMGFSSQGNRVEPVKAGGYFISGHTFTIPVIRQSNYDVLAIKTDSSGKTNSSCYHDASVNIINQQPVITSANASVSSLQILFNTDLLVNSFQNAQVFCPSNPCDSLNLHALFTFAANGNAYFFIDQSTVAPGHVINSWNWDFGDGSTSTLQNPTHTYTTPGFYVMCLSVTSSIAGVTCKDSVCYDIQIKDPTDRCDIVNMHAAFNYTGNGNTLSFTDLSNINPSFSIFNWNWDFGDGNFSNLQNPSHTYASTGNYKVCLMITGGNGQVNCMDTICEFIKAPFQPVDSCSGNIVRNGGFDQGAIPGDLSAPGASNFWTRWTWSPQLIDFDFCKDSFSMQMWGNQAVGEGFEQSVNIQKNGIYQLSFCGKRLATNYPLAQARFRAFVAPIVNADYPNCISGSCDEIFLSPVLSNNWVQYVSSPWIATQNYDLLAVSVWNNYNTLDKAYTSWLRVDDICIERIGTVATDEKDAFNSVKMYPNPVSGIVTLDFDKVLNKEFILDMTDLNGRRIYSTTVKAGESKIQIAMNYYNSGIYFIRLYNEHRIWWNAKLIKM
jgi:PKD repeat protein